MSRQLNRLPSSLVQIHYHNRAGGVSRVVKGYAEFFSRSAENPFKNIIVCHVEETLNENACAVMLDTPECDYYEFRSSASFYKKRKILVKKLTRILTDPEMIYPAAVICHNLTLGKNIALSSAVSYLAGCLPRNKFNFYSVVHDLAEEGRTDLLESIRSFEKYGIDIRNELYAVGAPVNFITLNEWTKSVLSVAGFSTVLIPNPVKNKKMSVLAYNREKTAAVKKQNGWIKSKPVFFYPARLISRKNVFEAVVLVCCFLKGTLILDRFSKKRDGFRRKEHVERLSSKYNLSIITDLGTDGLESSYSDLYNHSDFIVTTSISEGFGYAIHESWLYGKWLIGRRPLNFSSPYGVNLSGLYDILPVPTEWIPVNRLKALYIQMLQKCFGPGDYIHSVKHVFNNNETIDFGLLNEKMQIEIIESVMRDNGKMAQWIKILKVPRKGWPGLENIMKIDEKILNSNKELLSSSEEIFNKEIKKCLSLKPPNTSDADPLLIERKFRSLKQFRLLLTP